MINGALLKIDIILRNRR